MNELVLEKSFECAQQLLIQAALAGIMRNRSLLIDVIERAVKAGILEIVEREEGGQIKTTIRIPDETTDGEGA